MLLKLNSLRDPNVKHCWLNLITKDLWTKWNGRHWVLNWICIKRWKKPLSHLSWLFLFVLLFYLHSLLSFFPSRAARRKKLHFTASRSAGQKKKIRRNLLGIKFVAQTVTFWLQLGVTVHEFMLISICQCLCHIMIVSWSHGFKGLMVSMVSWFHRFRGVNSFMVS